MKFEHCLREKEITLPGYSKCFLTLDLNAVKSWPEINRLYGRFTSYIAEHGIEPVFEKVFGSLKAKEQFLQQRPPGSPVPLSYIEGLPLGDTPISSVAVYGIKKERDVATVSYLPPWRGELSVGTQVESDAGRYLYLHGFNDLPFAGDDSYSAFKVLFGEIADYLKDHGYHPGDIVRTWIYIQDIIKNYECLNKARREFFECYDIDYSSSSPVLPASTGIEGRSDFASGLSIDLVCIDKSRRHPRIERVYNRYQNEPEGEQYPHRPTFSRGMLIDDGEHKVVHLSGTASIDAQGKTVHLDDPKGQIRKTLANVREGILSQYNLGFSDLCLSTCFFKNEEYYRHFMEIGNETEGLLDACRTFVIGNVCRNDLLFEIDGVALGKPGGEK